jgi:tetratricopeptide (TPR) repeat protein
MILRRTIQPDHMPNRPAYYKRSDLPPVRLVMVAILLVMALASQATAANSDIMNNLETGFRAHREGEYDKAIDHYTRVIRDKDLRARDRAVTFLLRGEVQMDKGDYDQAILDFARAIKIKANYAHAFYFKGLAYEKKEKHSEAYQNVRAAVALQPDNEKYLSKLEFLKAVLTDRGETVPEN